MHGIAAQLVTDSDSARAASRHLLQVCRTTTRKSSSSCAKQPASTSPSAPPDAARRCLERALEEPPLPDTHARVLYELGCATLLTAPATTIGHLRTALAMPGLDGEQRVNAVFRLSEALLHNDQLEEAVRTVRRRPPATRTRPCGFGCRPSSTCGRASTPARPPRPAGPSGSPNSPAPAPAETTRNGPCSSCAASTP